MSEPAPRKGDWRPVAAVSLGGGLGALARYGLLVLWPPRTGAFPLATFAANVLGCLLIGALVVLAARFWPHRPLVRLSLGTGVLGGFTTFSTYVIDVRRLVADDAVGLAVLYLAVTVAAALAAAYAGSALTRRLLRSRP
ncbi:MAG TPA: fluoride efflux transporter CrcB [Phytomonospora sp.]